MSDQKSAALRRLKGLLIITAHSMSKNQAETAMDTLALAMETMNGLTPEDIDVGMMLEGDLGDLLPHDPAVGELTEAAAGETFTAMMQRMMATAAS